MNINYLVKYKQMNNKKTISVVTCSKDREFYLDMNIYSTVNIKNLNEHIIVDWSSHKEISSKTLSLNSKAKVYRVTGENDWWLARAYNFGFHFAQGDFILKLDADTTVNHKEFNLLNLDNLEYKNFTVDNNGYGNFLIKKDLMEKVNGFNEYIFGWGYDDRDFHDRVISNMNSEYIETQGSDFIKVTNHNDSLRLNSVYKNNKIKSEAQKIAFHKKNRFISNNLTWDTSYQKEYKISKDGSYKVSHFYSVKDLDYSIKSTSNGIFITSFLNEYYSKNIFNKLIIIFKFVPEVLFKVIFGFRFNPKITK